MATIWDEPASPFFRIAAVELHCNVAIDGLKVIADRTYLTNHAEHETVGSPTYNLAMA